MTDGYFDRAGNPITEERYRELERTFGYVLVARDYVGKLEVSTCWLGLDSDRVIETMVFVLDAAGERTGDTTTEQHYRNETEARIGHAAVVAHLRGLS